MIKDGMNRREFVGLTAAGIAGGVFGFGSPARAERQSGLWEPDRPLAVTGKKLTVRPVLMYSTPQRRPAPERPYNENRCHYNWRFIWDYGTGDMGNWGVHWLDIPLWTLDLGWPDAVCCSGGKFMYDDDKETPDTQLTFYEYPHLSLVWELRMWSKYPNEGGIDDSGTGATFYGDEQVLNITRAGWKAFTKDEKKLIAQGHAGDDKFLLHANNFIDSMLSRKAPIADIASGHVSATVAILGNVAWLAGEKIRYDPEKDKLDKSEKDHLLTRTYREKWPLPAL